MRAWPMRKGTCSIPPPQQRMRFTLPKTKTHGLNHELPSKRAVTYFSGTKIRVSSARARLTSEFGKGSGEPRRTNHPNTMYLKIIHYVRMMMNRFYCKALLRS